MIDNCTTSDGCLYIDTNQVHVLGRVWSNKVHASFDQRFKRSSSCFGDLKYNYHFFVNFLQILNRNDKIILQKP